MTTPSRKRKGVQEEESASIFSGLFNGSKRRKAEIPLLGAGSSAGGSGRLAEINNLSNKRLTFSPQISSKTNGVVKDDSSSGVKSTNRNEPKEAPKVSDGTSDPFPPDTKALSRRRVFYRQQDQKRSKARSKRRQLELVKANHRENAGRLAQQPKELIFMPPTEQPETFRSAVGPVRLGVNQQRSRVQPIRLQPKKVSFKEKKEEVSSRMPKLNRTTTPHPTKLEKPRASPSEPTRETSRPVSSLVPSQSLIYRDPHRQGSYKFSKIASDRKNSGGKRSFRDFILEAGLMNDVSKFTLTPTSKLFSFVDRKACQCQSRKPEVISAKPLQSVPEDVVVGAEPSSSGTSPKRQKVVGSGWGDNMFQKNVWRCEVCSVESPMTAIECLACGAPRPGTSASKSKPENGQAKTTAPGLTFGVSSQNTDSSKKISFGFGAKPSSDVKTAFGGGQTKDSGNPAGKAPISGGFVFSSQSSSFKTENGVGTNPFSSSVAVSSKSDPSAPVEGTTSHEQPKPPSQQSTFEKPKISFGFPVSKTAGTDATSENTETKDVTNTSSSAPIPAELPDSKKETATRQGKTPASFAGGFLTNHEKGTALTASVVSTATAEPPAPSTMPSENKNTSPKKDGNQENSKKSGFVFGAAATVPPATTSEKDSTKKPLTFGVTNAAPTKPEKTQGFSFGVAPTSQGSGTPNPFATSSQTPITSFTSSFGKTNAVASDQMTDVSTGSGSSTVPPTGTNSVPFAFGSQTQQPFGAGNQPSFSSNAAPKPAISFGSTTPAIASKSPGFASSAQPTSSQFGNPFGAMNQGAKPQPTFGSGTVATPSTGGFGGATGLKSQPGGFVTPVMSNQSHMGFPTPSEPSQVSMTQTKSGFTFGSGTPAGGSISFGASTPAPPSTAPTGFGGTNHTPGGTGFGFGAQTPQPSGAGPVSSTSFGSAGASMGGFSMGSSGPKPRRRILRAKRPRGSSTPFK